MVASSISIIPFFNLLEELKTRKRKGWENENIKNPESIADHMYRMGVITMMCTDPNLDKAKMMQIALVHDMAEAIVGDITPLDNIPKAEKQALELKAMQDICETKLTTAYRVNADQIMALFLEYENKSTPEARFVKDVDKFELVLQTFEYEQAGKVGRLDSFAASSQQIEHPLVKEWCAEVLREREEWWNARGN